MTGMRKKPRCDDTEQRFPKTNDRDFSLAFSVEENKRINQLGVNEKGGSTWHQESNISEL